MKTPRFLEYIEADGRQYIDTAVHLYVMGTVEVHVRLTQPSIGRETLFGVRRGEGRRFSALFDEDKGGNIGSLKFQDSGGVDFDRQYEEWDTGFKKDAEYDGPLRVYLCGREDLMEKAPGRAQFNFWRDGSYMTYTHEFKSGSATLPYPGNMYLCACHDFDEGAVDFAHMRLYKCTILEAAGLFARVFYPALDDEGRACLYDAVSDSYFYSKGEADFTAGPPINQMILRSRYNGRLRNIEAVSLPCSGFFTDDSYKHPSDPRGYLYEFVGYDFDSEAFTAVIPTRDYRDTGASFDLSYKDQVFDTFAVFKFLWGWLCKDSDGVFYGQNDDGSRLNLGVHPLTAQVFRDYSFRNYPGADMLEELSSPSILYWAKQDAPAAFEATLKGTPPLPQLVTFPTATLRKALAYITIPAEPDTTLWNVSFDGGSTWYKYEGEWIQVTEEGDGCHKRRFELLDKDDWAAVLTNNTVRLRAWMRKDAWVAAIRLEYVEED